MKTALITGGGIVTVLAGSVLLARYGRSRFAKECANAWMNLDGAPAACALDAGDYNWLTAIGMGLRAITGGNVYSNYAPPGTPPSRLLTQPPGQVMPPGQMQQGQAGNVFTTTQAS